MKIERARSAVWRRRDARIAGSWQVACCGSVATLCSTARLTVFAALAFAWALVAGSPFAAAIESDRKADTPTAIEDPGFNPESLAARIESISNDTSLPADVRELAVASYKAALDALRDADAWDFKARKYLRLAEEAAGHMQRLAAPGQEGSLREKDTDVPLEVLEARAAELRTRVATTRAELDEVAAEQQRRALRRTEIPVRRSEIKRQLSGLRVESGPTVMADTRSEPQRARFVRTAAEERALALEAAALDAEVASYDARRELLALRRDVASREIAWLQSQLQALQTKVDERRKLEAENAAAAATGTEEATADAHPLLRAAAARNAELASARTGPDGIVNRLERARAFAERIEARSEKVARDFAAVQERARLVGFTPTVGALLRKQKLELPDKSFHRGKIRNRQDEIGSVQLALLELENERAGLADPAGAARQAVEKEAADLSPNEKQRLTAELTTLLEMQRGYLNSLLEDYDTYFLTLVELDSKQRELLAATSEFGDYIETHVLWIRSTTPLGARSFSGAWAAATWLMSPIQGGRLLDEVRAIVVRSPIVLVVTFLVVGGVFALRRRVADYDRRLAREGSERPEGAVKFLVVGLVTATLTAARWPVVLWLIAWVLGEATGDHARALSEGAETAGDVLFLGNFLLQIAKRDGVSTRHFGWSEKACAAVRRYVFTALVGVVPAAFLVSTMQGQPSDEWRESLGRIAFIVGAASVAVLAFRLLRPHGPVIDALGSSGGERSVIYRGRKFIGPLIFALCALLIGLAALGYYFAALSIAPHVTATIRLIVAISLVQSIALRWLALARRHNQAAEATPLGDVAVAADAALSSVPMPLVKDRRLVGNVAAFVLVVGLLLIWNDVLPAFNILNRVELWTVNASQTYEVKTDAGVEMRTGIRQIPITLGTLIQSLVILFVAIAASRHLPGLVEMSLLKRMRIDAGVTNAIKTIFGYALVLVGVFAAAGRLGLAWSQVQWLAAAVSVGLGFGLQEIFANFVSGLILLFERPIRIGDTVTLGGVSGNVSRINIRATTIVDWDNKELIVPNKEFVTGQLINWTLSNTILRLTVAVGIAYGSDTKLAEQILLETAKKNPNVVDDPPPTVVFSGFGDSALNFELRVFVPHIRYLVPTRHALHMKIDEAFRAAGIEIAFPQRDLHLRSISTPVPVRVER
jgi:potassium efflux system protein